MTFHQSNHCTCKKHCDRCRSKIDGLSWRQSVRKVFKELADDNYDCPSGFEWSTKPIKPKKERKQEHYKFIEKQLKSIPDCPLSDWCKKMVIQCYEMMIHPPNYITCKTRKAFRSRCMSKIDYYISLVNNNATV